MSDKTDQHRNHLASVHLSRGTPGEGPPDYILLDLHLHAGPEAVAGLFARARAIADRRPPAAAPDPADQSRVDGLRKRQVEIREELSAIDAARKDPTEMLALRTRYGYRDTWELLDRLDAHYDLLRAEEGQVERDLVQAVNRRDQQAAARSRELVATQRRELDARHRAAVHRIAERVQAALDPADVAELMACQMSMGGFSG